MAGALQFRIQEADIERCVVNDKTRVANEGQKIFRDFSKRWLVLEEFLGQAVHRKSFGRNIALGIEITVKRLAGRNPIDQFNAADFYQAMALIGIEPGCFRIEDDLTHRRS